MENQVRHNAELPNVRALHHWNTDCKVVLACFLGDPFKEERKEERRGLMFLDGSSV